MTKIPFLSSSLVENCSLKDAVRFSAVKKNAIHWTRNLVALLTLQCRISTLQFCESSEEYIAVPCSVIKGRKKVVQQITCTAMQCSQIQCNGEPPEIWVSEWPEPKVDIRPAAAREKGSGRSALSGPVREAPTKRKWCSNGILSKRVSALSGPVTCIQLLEYPIPRVVS